MAQGTWKGADGVLSRRKGHGSSVPYALCLPDSHYADTRLDTPHAGTANNFGTGLCRGLE